MSDRDRTRGEGGIQAYTNWGRIYQLTNEVSDTEKEDLEVELT